MAIQRVKAQTVFFTTIRFTCAFRPLYAARTILGQKIPGVSSKATSVLYLDGEPCTEKEALHLKALTQASRFIGQFEMRVKEKQAVRKTLFKSTSKKLLMAFHWRRANKDTFDTFICLKGWTVVKSSTEADLQITKGCQEDYVVATTDSDLLAYSRVKTIWRTISSSNILGYDLDSIIKHLEGPTKGR
ncbi:hypothetical protein BX616_008351 [Lobosporangium transversale]|nr:hypothetical protein BX616_008351 [Lobosporangium transversale]